MAKPKLTKSLANQIFVEKGYFYGLQRVLNDYEVPKELGARLKARLFQHILIKILEARKEMAKLQAAVARLESACRAGATPQLSEGDTALSPSVNRLMDEMRAFDGWTISLLDTDISLMATVVNPETAGVRIKGLQNAFWQLWERRRNVGAFDNFPEEFGAVMASYLDQT